MKIIKMLKDHAIFILLAVLFVSPIALSFGLNIMQGRAEIDELRQVIASKDNVSQDYVNGWNDCISHLKHIRERATNTTAATIN